MSPLCTQRWGLTVRCLRYMSNKNTKNIECELHVGYARVWRWCDVCRARFTHVWRSFGVNNKSYIIDHDIDVLALTETWLTKSSRDEKWITTVTPSGYSFVNVPRSQGSGGGVAMIHKTSLNITLQSEECKSTLASFEQLACKMSVNSLVVDLVFVYRPPPSRKKQTDPKPILWRICWFSQQRSYVKQPGAHRRRYQYSMELWLWRSEAYQGCSWEAKSASDGRWANTHKW